MNHIRFILETLRYPFEREKIINGKPDFILPHSALYHKNPGGCILITAKRTLRERWRQIITEGFRSPQYFLVTIDKSKRTEELKEMAGHRVYMVIPKSLKDSVTAYKVAGNVINVQDLLVGYLDPTTIRWRRAGIVR